MKLIEVRIKEAFDNMFKDGDITKLIKAVASVADYCADDEIQVQIMYEAIDAQPHIFLSDEYLENGGYKNENS